MKTVTSGLFLYLAFASVAGGNDSSSPVIQMIWRDGKLLEEPHWSATENALYWVDTPKKTFYRLDGSSGNITSRQIDYGEVSLGITVKDNPGLLVVSVRSELFLLRWDAPAGDEALRLISAVDVGKPNNRINDGKADGKGRLWFGTMGKYINEDTVIGQASLYMIDQFNYANPEVKVRPVSLSNGIAWNRNKTSMFYNDSPTKHVDVFDYNFDTGEIGNRTHLFSLVANNITGIPDGMTIDKDDNLWIACYGSGMVIKVDSRTGKLLDKIVLPTTYVTSVMWGGSDLSTLYVTSSRKELTPEELVQQPAAGSLFAVEGTGTSGLPENQFVFPGAAIY